MRWKLSSQGEVFYRSLYRIRRLEEELARIFPSDKIKSPMHLSIGQEAVAVGVCEALAPQDVVFGTYRSHAYFLAKGGDMRRMTAELYGKVDGCARGKAGSMHLIETSRGIMGASGVVATTIPHAVGFAWACRHQQKDIVTVSFFGDGASEEGVFYESLNFAALKQLPMIFICENNQYAIHTHQKKRQAVPDIAAKGAAFGIRAEVLPDDVSVICNRVGSAVRAVRERKEGPFFFECQTYRWREHVGPNEDYALGYRSLAEIEEWKGRDQLKKIGAELSPAIKERIDREVEQEIKEALAFAEASPFPEAAELTRHVFTE